MRRKITHLGLPAMALLALFGGRIQAQTAPPFFEPAVSSGTVEVKLYPTEDVAAGTPTLVTFGFPFTRGSVTAAELANVRVMSSGGTEIPAYVSEMTPWRHISNSSINNQSVRVAEIQIEYTFSTTFPGSESIFIEFGGTPRTMNVATLTDPKSAWHLVTTGEFVAGDNVMEPDVFAVLPKEYLTNGALKLTRMLPFDSSVPATREDPALVDVATYPGYTKKDHASHNFFFTIINEDDPQVLPENENPYKTDYEPWLYDRTTAMYNLYMQSGNFKVLREAVRNAQYYKNQLYDDTTIPANAIGVFKLKVPSPSDYIGNNGAMYSYNEGLTYTYWLTGDTDMLDPIEWVVNAHEENDPPTQWSPSAGSWTERFTSFRLLVNTVAYEVTGDVTYKNNLTSQYTSLIWHQNGAGGALPASRIDGGLYHYGSQHGDGTPTELVASSWMTALICEAMVRVYGVSEDPAVANFIRRLGTFEKAALKADDMHSYDEPGPLWYGDYMMRYDGASDERDGTEIEHSMDVAVTIAWAAYFSSVTGAPDPTLYTAANRAWASYDIGVNYWIRPAAPPLGLTAYRINPPRKYGWEYTPSASFTWLMEGMGPVLGIEEDAETEKNLATLYPNPASNVLNIQSAKDELLNLIMVDALGAVVYTTTLTGTMNQIDVSHLSKGIYFIRLSNAANEQTQFRFVKE